MKTAASVIDYSKWDRLVAEEEDDVIEEDEIMFVNGDLGCIDLEGLAEKNEEKEGEKKNETEQLNIDYGEEIFEPYGEFDPPETSDEGREAESEETMEKQEEIFCKLHPQRLLCQQSGSTASTAGSFKADSPLQRHMRIAAAHVDWVELRDAGRNQGP